MEDFWAKTNPIVLAQEAMGVEPATIYSGKVFMGPGLGTLDQEGNLMEENAVLGVKTLVKAIEIVCRYSGVED